MVRKTAYASGDMALHLLQTSIKPGEIKLDRLRDNLHAILTPHVRIHEVWLLITNSSIGFLC